MYGKRRRVYRILMGKHEGKRQFGTHWRRWENNINMDLQEVECRTMDWIDLTQDKDRWRDLVSAVTKLRLPQKERLILANCYTE
jgi:hypothetical protein